jgi:hypothetical protein
MKNMNSTPKALTQADGRFEIVEDRGAYSGMRPELNVRRCAALHDLGHLSFGHPAVAAIIARPSTGCTYDGGRLYPVSESEVADLLAAEEVAAKPRTITPEERAETERLNAAERRHLAARRMESEGYEH